MERWHLLYVLLTFSIGVAALGIVTIVWQQTRAKFIRAYLYLHVAWTLAVFLRMFFLYLHTSLPGIPPRVIGSMAYAEDFLVKYALMLTIPFFFHEFLAFPQARIRNTLFSAFVAATWLVAHGVTFWEASNATFEQIGNLLTDTALTAILLYAVTAGVYYARRLDDPVKKAFARRIAIFVGICLPGIMDELWLHAIFPIPIFPILYSGVSIMFTAYLLRHVVNHAPASTAYSDDSPESSPGVSGSGTSHEAVFQRYLISSREQDVVNLVLAGRSNQEIGETLHISLSTVKTHLRNIYQKIDVKSRYELMTRFRMPQGPPE